MATEPTTVPLDQRLSRRLATALTSGPVRIGLALFAGLLLALATPWLGTTTYDQKIESLLPDSEPAVQSFAKLREELGGDAAFIVVWHEPELMAADGSGLTRLKQIVEQSQALPEVLGTLSLLELNRALQMMRPAAAIGLLGGKANPYPIVDADDPLAASFRDMFAGYTHAPDGKWAGVVVLMKPGADHAHVIREVRAIAEAVCGPAEKLSLVGEPVLIVEGLKLLADDGRRLSWIVIGLLSVTLLVLLRRLRWVVAILIAVFWSRWLTHAFLKMIGLQLTMVSGMLDAVLTVVTVAAAMHIGLRNSSDIQRYPAREAARRTWQDLIAPVFWSLATTAVGFVSLVVSVIIPVRQFGWMMAVGTMLSLVAIGVWFPLFAGPPQPQTVRRQSGLNRWLRRWLLLALEGISRYRSALVVSMLIASILSVIGVWMLQVETNFLRNFRAGSPLVSAYELVEAEFGGAGVWDVVLPAPAKIDNAYLDRVRGLEDQLRAIETAGGAKLTKVLSLADADAAAAQHSTLLAAAGPTARFQGMQAAIPAFYATLVSDENRPERWLRILLRSREQLKAEDKVQLIAEVQSAIDRFQASNVEQANEDNRPPLLTGYYVILTRLVSHLLADQWSSFVLASIGILLCVRLAVGSWKLAMLATVPSVLPIMMVLGGVGLVGMPINLGAAMIAAVSVGLTIDGSIHYLYAYQKSRREGRRLHRSLQSAQRATGLPVTLATVSLAAGLLTLVSSPLLPTAAFGLLAGITMLAGLVGNLVMLPGLIYYFEDR